MTLPNGWTVASIGDCTVDRVEQGEPGARPVPYIDIGSIDRDLKRIAATRHVTRETAPTRARQWVKPGDVLVSLTRPNLNAVAMIPEALDGAISSTGFDVLRARGVMAEWLFNRVRSDAFVADVCAGVQGVVYPAIRPADVRRHQLPIPPMQEQHRIVEAIDSYLSRVDDAAINLEHTLDKLRAYRTSVLKAAVEGRLVPTEDSVARSQERTYESAAGLLAKTEIPPRPNRWNTRSKDLILAHSALAVGNPGSSLPQGWAWSALVDIARMESGHTPSRNHPEWWDGDVPWIGIVDARGHDGGTIYDTIQHTNAAGLANSAARLLPTGTVCISRTASVGYVVVTGRPMATSQDFVNWSPTGAVLSDWLRVVFTADREALRRFGKGSVHKTIYFPEWLSVHVAVPPLAEQQRIVAEVDRLLSASDVAQISITNQLRRCGRLSESVLKWAFEGKLVDQEESDEPAQVVRSLQAPGDAASRKRNVKRDS